MSDGLPSLYNSDRVIELEAERDFVLTKLDEKETARGAQTSDRNLSDVCYPLPEILPSAPTIWRERWNDILEASLTVIGPLEDFKPWIALLLDHLSPVDLLKSVKTLPNMDHFRSIVNIVQARRNYMRSHKSLNSQDAPPKLKILVFGGSVTLGVLCNSNAIGKPLRRMRRKCSWANRFEMLVNTILGFDAITVLNEALGGTNSEVARMRIEYDLLPPSMPDPDIIINAYSSNDMHILSMLEAESKNLSLSDALFDMTQKFIRSVEKHKACDDENKRPLLVYFDDYLGNEQHEILDTMAFSSTMQVLTNYYEIMSISYSDIVRQKVYANTRETWFSPNWYETGEYTRQIHVGMGAHISMMWVFAFNFLNAFIVFCNEEAVHMRLKDHNQPINFLAPNYKGEEKPLYMFEGGTNFTNISLKPSIAQGPSTIPPGIIPELNADLKLQDISLLWSESTKKYQRNCTEQNTRLEKKCNFTWIASTNKIDSIESLESKMNETLKSNIGWQVSDDNNKLGFATETNGATFVMELDIVKPIKTLNFLVMKSYGENWKGSRVQIVVSRIGNQIEQIDEIELEGFHSTEISVSQNVKLDIMGINTGDRMKIDVLLIGGARFKFTGMSFCYE